MGSNRRLDLSVINVVDVEATCWDGSGRPEGQTSEIIEIGVCTFDVRAKTRGRKRALLVTPEHSEVSDFCTALTGHTQERLEEEGVALADACDLLREQYKSDRRPWASWGDYDRDLFRRQCSWPNGPRFRVPTYPFGHWHMNLRLLFSLGAKLDHEATLREALELKGYQFEGRQHNGADDAWNIARLLKDVLKDLRTEWW